MLTLHIELSLHVEADRLDSWNINIEDIKFIIEHSTKRHNAGAIFYQLRHKNLDNVHSRKDYERLVGTTVLTCKYCGLYVITVYRNVRAFKEDMKKQKYDTSKKTRYCPCCDSNKIA